MRQTTLIIIAILCFGTINAAKQPSPDAIISKADSAYNAKKYSEAADLYASVLRDFGASSDVYYNLGNAYFRMGKTAQSILSYERALKVDPSNNDARANLEYIKTTLEDKPEDNATILGKLHNSVIAMMSPNAWTWTTFILFLVLLGLIGLYLFMSDIKIRKIGFFGSIVLLFVFVYIVVVAYQSATAIDNDKIAIVTVPSANLTSTPSATIDKNDKIVPVHEGTRLEIIDSINSANNTGAQLWYHVKVNNSTAAWIDASNVEKV